MPDVEVTQESVEVWVESPPDDPRVTAMAVEVWCVSPVVADSPRRVVRVII